MRENILEEDETVVESDLEELVYDLETLPREQKIDIDVGDHTQYLLDAEDYTDEEVEGYVRELGAAIVELAGEESDYHRLTVDNNELEEYLSS